VNQSGLSGDFPKLGCSAAHGSSPTASASTSTATPAEAPEIIEAIPVYKTMQVTVGQWEGKDVSVTIRLNCTGDVKGLKETFPEAFDRHFKEIKKGSPSVKKLSRASKKLSNYQRDSYRGRRKFPFTVCEPDHFLDVGGNIGLTAVHALIHGASRVTIVEPIPSNLELLKENLKQFGHRVTIVEKCVVAQGDERVKDGMILLKDEGWRSKINTVTGDIKAPVIHLQDLLDEYKPSMCKIDIEGAEIDVLQDNIEWGECVKLAFEYTVKEEKAAQIQSALQAAGWDTDSWIPSVFNTDVDHGASPIDRVLCCTRAPYANEKAAEYLEVLTALRRLNIGVDTDRTKKYKKGDKNFRRTLYGQTLGLKVQGGMNISALTEKNPETVKLITKLACDQLPEDYKFSCVFVTKDSQYPVHIDSGNHGPSLINFPPPPTNSAPFLNFSSDPSRHMNSGKVVTSGPFCYFGGGKVTSK
jgi:FkbM family methyltransferase